VKNKNYRRFLSFFTTAVLLMPGIVLSQTTIEGKVFYKDDATPAASVSVEIMNRKGVETMTNAAGSFSLRIPDSKKNDTVLISSVGYTSIKLPLHIASKRSEFVLTENVKNLTAVTIFNSHEVIGSNSESVGYYRSWSYKNKGAEIGRYFKLPYKKFKIDKIRFKAGNTCDTCLLRLHLRYIDNTGQPGNEIIEDSISVLVRNLSLDSKVSEFDLTPYDFTFTQNEFFVGLELLNCGNGKKGSCAFNFAGTEKGEYIYRTNDTGDWKTTDDYTIYLKLFLRF
jgi:hypothetical protein